MIAAIAGLLIYTAGLFAHRDLCRQPNTDHLCAGNSGVPRSQMPQVTGVVRRHFLEEMSEVTEVTLERIPAHQLTPVQNELNRDIVYDMLRANQANRFSPCDFPILVARNETHNNIIDGHHTATACRLLGGSQLAAVIRDFGNTVFSLLRNFPGVGRLNLGDARKI